MEGLHNSTVYLSVSSRFPSRDQNAPSLRRRRIADVRQTGCVATLLVLNLLVVVDEKGQQVRNFVHMLCAVLVVQHLVF